MKLYFTQSIKQFKRFDIFFYLALLTFIDQFRYDTIMFGMFIMLKI